MRFKLVLSVKSESFGSVLPVSYQYELSAAVYRRIREISSYIYTGFRATVSHRSMIAVIACFRFQIYISPAFG